MKTITKSALITGVSSGIGLATSRRLLEEGYEVTGVARDFSKLVDSGVDALEKVVCDLSDVDTLPTKLKAIQQQFDLLVLNAGFGKFGAIEQFSHQQIREMVDTNLVSNLFLIKHFLPRMKAQGGGDIVLIGSESALRGAKAGAVYCATKFAIRGLAQSLRADCSTANIRVILVNPGPVDSNFFETLDFTPQTGEDFSVKPESVADAIIQAVHQPRNVVVEEINLQPMKRSFSKKG